MRVQIEIQGHQRYRVVEGEVLMWGSTVEAFNEGRDKLMVPCCIVRHDNDDVEVVPLKTDLTWTSIKALRTV
jgi:hypothetical protein